MECTVFFVGFLLSDFSVALLCDSFLHYHAMQQRVILTTGVLLGWENSQVSMSCCLA